MTFQQDGTTRIAGDSAGNHPWTWLAAIAGAVIICFALVATVGTFINSGLAG
jgi:hypothetical protein